MQQRGVHSRRNAQGNYRMRKVISLALAIVLVASGVYLLFHELIDAPTSAAHLVAIGGLLTVGGLAWMWTDYVASKTPR